VLNLYSNDGERLVEGASSLPVLISSPLLLVGATAYAICLIGAWALIGLVILLLTLPVQVRMLGVLTITCIRTQKFLSYASSAIFVRVSS